MTQNNNNLTLPYLNGCTFSTFRGDRSFHDMLAVLEPIQAQDWYPYKGSNFEEIKHDYSNLTHFDIHRDLVIAFKNNQPVAYGRISWDIEQPSQNRIFYAAVFVKPESEFFPLYQAFLDWFHIRALEISKSLALAPASFISISVFEQEEEYIKATKANEYEVVRYFYTMKRDLIDIPDHPLPDGFKVKPVTPEQYRRIYDATNEAFRDHWGHVEPEEGDYEKWKDDPFFFTPGIWKVAWDGEEVAGMVLNFINKNENKATGIQTGWAENIAVRRPWRRRGLAKALVCLSMKMFKEMGMSEVKLMVDSESPSGANKLYLDLGYVVTISNVIFRKPLKLEGG